MNFCSANNQKDIFLVIIDKSSIDQWMVHYNQEKTHSGKYCLGKTPMQTFQHTIPLVKQRLLEALKEEQQWLDTVVGVKTATIADNLQQVF